MGWYNNLGSLSRIKNSCHSGWGDCRLVWVLFARVVFVSAVGPLLSRNCNVLLTSPRVVKHSTFIWNLLICASIWIVKTIESLSSRFGGEVSPVICVCLLARNWHRRGNAFGVSTYHLEVETLICVIQIVLQMIIYQLHLHVQDLALDALFRWHLFDWWHSLGRLKVSNCTALYRLVLSISFEMWTLSSLLRTLILCWGQIFLLVLTICLMQSNGLIRMYNNFWIMLGSWCFRACWKISRSEEAGVNLSLGYLCFNREIMMGSRTRRLQNYAVDKIVVHKLLIILWLLLFHNSKSV